MRFASFIMPTKDVTEFMDVFASNGDLYKFYFDISILYWKANLENLRSHIFVYEWCDSP